MKTASLASYITNVNLKNEYIEIDPKKSIIVDVNGIEYIVGEEAMNRTNSSTRMHGGNLKSPQYIALLKAITAKALGQGQFEIPIGLSVPYKEINNFRVGARKNFLKPELKEILKDALANIKFKSGASDDDYQNCQVSIKDDVLVLFENIAVMYTIPRELKNYGLFQFGHGDMQRTVMKDGKPLHEAIYHNEGLRCAIEILKEELGVTVGEADQAWRNGYIQVGNGLEKEKKDIKEAIKKASHIYIDKFLGEAINTLDKHSLKSLIISGGGTFSEPFMEAFKAEVEPRGYKVYNIKDIPKGDPNLVGNPSFTCAIGLTQAYDNNYKLGIDVGNSFLKAAYYE